jgi:hypothetical protein
MMAFSMKNGIILLVLPVSRLPGHSFKGCVLFTDTFFTLVGREGERHEGMEKGSMVVYDEHLSTCAQPLPKSVSSILFSVQDVK